MKTPFFSLLAVAALVSVSLTACEKDNKGQLDPEAMISIRPAAGVKAQTGHLTAKEIVETAANMYWYNKAFQETPIVRTFSETQKDFVNNRLLMWGTDIIGQNGTYEIDFIKGEDIIINQIGTKDTIAYIPNAVLRAADIAIKAAYDAGDYKTCYRLFDEAFTFVPITGAEWRELKKQGKN